MITLKVESYDRARRGTLTWRPGRTPRLAAGTLNTSEREGVVQTMTAPFMVAGATAKVLDGGTNTAHLPNESREAFLYAAGLLPGVWVRPLWDTLQERNAA